jgi:hypothetical protein
MTVAQSKERERLRKDVRPIEFNGCVITSDSSRDASSYDMFFNVKTGSASIPGHEDLGMKMVINPDDDNTLVVKTPYFNDKDDIHLELVKKIIVAFRASTEIIYDGNEEDGSLSEFAGKVMYRYIDGIMMSDPNGLVNGQI